VVAHAQDVGTQRAVEIRLWVIRADVAGRFGHLIAHGSSAIVAPDGSFVCRAEVFSEDLLIAEIDGGVPR